jgi:hypothetical protein
VILRIGCTASTFLIEFVLVAEAGPVRASVITGVNLAAPRSWASPCWAGA